MKPVQSPPPEPQPLAPSPAHQLGVRFDEVRSFTEKLCEPLEPEDFVVQSMVDASPAKWHLAHTSWFFETFILKPHLKGYRSAVPEYAYLFNSYYNAAGPMHGRDRRGLISRPTVAETMKYRRHIDQAMGRMLEETETDPQLQEVVWPLTELGLHHEQQHQELLLTDIKHVLAQNPLYPVYRSRRGNAASGGGRASWVSYPEGVFEVGYDGTGFSYDNEGPRHRQFLEPFELSSRLVTNGEFMAFIEDGGYRRPEFWLSLGWNTVREFAWEAPLYWERRDGLWHSFTLSGLREIDEGEPFCHVSFFEADAYARWAGARLPTEAEWEVAAADLDPRQGNFVEEERFHPVPPKHAEGEESLQQVYGDVWEWTGSSYRPYPGYKPPDGALGEYNGKFMCNQMVLRGGSCATSRSHIRPTYRNFFQPDKRWQFCGIRLAR